MLKDGRTDPCFNGNWAINLANNYENTKILLLLWNDKRVKGTLQNDNFLLYKKLIQQDIKDKIGEF